MNIKARQRLARLHAMLGSDHAGERENARAKLVELLRQHGKTWNDLPELLQAASAADTSTRNATQGANEESAGPPVPLPLDRLTTMLAEYVQLPDPAYLTIALWIALTFVFEQFMVSPRLAFVSPVRGCGKTTVLDLLAALCDRPCRCDGISAAGIYRLIDRDRPTLLCDEADTYDLLSNGPLRAVFNSGHRRGGHILRADGRFATFSPMAVAAIGARSLPFPLLHRSILIRMTRADGTRPLRRFDDLDATIIAELNAMREVLSSWSRGAVLAGDPVLPTELRNRPADNWRPLIAIADACGGDWGTRTREAAIALSSGLQYEDPGVMLLGDIRRVFNAHGVDRIHSQFLVDSLVAMEGAPWSEWRGKVGDRQPRPLTQPGLADMLRDFDIKPMSIWLGPRTLGSKSRKGYYRRQFEAVWRAYCRPDDEHRPLVLRSA